MWSRKELKSKGKSAFKANYWRCVLVALLVSLISGGIAAGTAGGNSSLHNMQNKQSITQEAEDMQLSSNLEEDTDWNAVIDQISSADKESLMIAIPIIIVILLIFAAFGVAVSILIVNPLKVGCQRFFTQNSDESAGLKEVVYGFENGFRNVVKTMFMTDIFIILWTLLFIIPGIIKSYSYRMVPYILANEPELGGREVIDRSREMMNGNKWRAFVLDLSFILWALLTIVTLGLAGIFYVSPYIEATNAELYKALR